MNKKIKLIILLFLFIFLSCSLRILSINQLKNQYLLKEYKNILKEVKSNEIVTENKDLMEELNKINDFFSQRKIIIKNLNYIKEPKDKKYIVLKVEFDCDLSSFLDTMIFFNNEDYNIFNFVAKKDVDKFNFVVEAKTDYEKIKR
ncbi:hypothetical protein WG909_14950 [Peptostreptococcaceae bacterium AGR-M142]